MRRPPRQSEISESHLVFRPHRAGFTAITVRGLAALALLAQRVPLRERSANWNRNRLFYLWIVPLLLNSVGRLVLVLMGHQGLGVIYFTLSAPLVPGGGGTTFLGWRWRIDSRLRE